MNYYHHGNEVCKYTYRFVHAMGPKRFKNLLSHYAKYGLVPRVHGNVKRLPPNAASFNKIKSVVKFISNFATVLYQGACQGSLVTKRHYCCHHTCQKGMFIETISKLVKISPWVAVNLKIFGINYSLIFRI